MTEAAAFQATIHGFRTVPSRGVVSITIEAPIEHHAQIALIAEHGAWVAVARLQEPVKGGADDRRIDEAQESKPAAASTPQRTSKRDWRDMQPAQQAGIRCEEPIFRQFLAEEYHRHGDVAVIVRELCGVPSRADLNTNHQARAFWHQLDNKFQAWKAAEHA